MSELTVEEVRDRRSKYIGYTGWFVSGGLSAVFDVAIWQWAIMIIPIAMVSGITEIRRADR